MENTPFFSIVMPIYNVADYLEQAIDSVLHQTFADFEIILVNDASPDDCTAICSRYSEKYAQITTYTHETNQGLSAARNTGFSAVRGQYVLFMDSDDFVEPDLLETVYAALQENQAELVVFGCKEDYYDKLGVCTKTVEMKPAAAICRTQDAVRAQIIQLEKGTFYGYAWNKFYSVRHIRENNLQYENVVLIEDITFNVQFCENITAMNVLDITPYHYAKRGTNSLTSKYVPDYYKVHRARIEMLYNQQLGWGILDKETKKTLANIFTRYIFSALSRNCDKRAQMTRKARRAWLQAVFADALFQDLMPFAAADSPVLQTMIRLLQKKRSGLCLFLGHTIYFVQNRLNAVFIRIKQVRK